MKKIITVLIFVTFVLRGTAQDEQADNLSKDSLPAHNTVYTSPLPVPYARYEYLKYANFTASGTGYTAFKPLMYKYVSTESEMEKKQKALYKDKHSWWGRKFWNENMLSVSGDGYWFHLDPYVDLQLGNERQAGNYTYNNTRAVHIEGALSDKVGFYSTIMESQGRFARYVNEYARLRKPTQAYAVVPGRDVSKQFGTTGFDYPMSTGGIYVSPMKFIDVSFGYDKHFIGNGQRSLFLSDTGSPYTFLKIDSHFWHIRYTNLWTWLRDVNTDTGSGNPFKRKFTAIHYLDWHATKKLNIGLYESVSWAKTEDRGFDVQYLNPVILFRAMEYANGSRGGNAMVGAAAKYTFIPGLQLYSQFILDELTVKEFFQHPDYWANKYGYQLGLHYYNSFKIKGLHLQAEYNTVRPYTYAHVHPSLQYGHVNQALAHPWGANFKEWIFRADYYRGRWYGTAQITAGTKGFDYVDSQADGYVSYGGDIFSNYTFRPGNYGIETGQGNKGHLKLMYLEAGYLINPSTGLKFFGEVLYRDFHLQSPLAHLPEGKTLWFNVGIRSNLPDWDFIF